MSLIDTFTDSDWASDKTDRKSVSCVVTLIGEHCIRRQTATQSAPGLSSGEAEYVGNVEGASIGIAVRSMARDFRDERAVRIAEKAIHTTTTVMRSFGSKPALDVLERPARLSREQETDERGRAVPGTKVTAGTSTIRVLPEDVRKVYSTAPGSRLFEAVCLSPGANTSGQENVEHAHA